MILVNDRQPLPRRWSAIQDVEQLREGDSSSIMIVKRIVVLPTGCHADSRPRRGD
jgi:hypothetical protein